MRKDLLSRKKLRLLILLILLLVGQSAFSQEISVSGKVTSSLEGIPLPGVSIVEKGTANGVVSDYDGNYQLTVASNATLVFSYVGFMTEEIAVNNQSILNVALSEDLTRLEEIVVVGYGTQKKENLTGSISTVKLEDVKNRPIANATQVLAGMAPGVSVTQNSGQPGGDGATIRIRGVGTLGNNNPLVLIDGIRGELGNVNPADIETITVLKDAASAAIYGARAANGVILVTTKTGQEDRLRVSYDGYTGIQKATRIPEYVTNSVQYMESLNQAIFNESPTADPEFTQEEIDGFRNGTDPFLYPNTDWQDLMYRDANITSHNLSVRGGGKKTTYSLSLGHIDQEGVVLGTSTKQYTARLNLDTKVSEKFSYYLKLSGRHDDVDQPVVGSNTLIGWIDRALPIQAPFLADGRYAAPRLGFPNSTHPIAGAREGRNDTSWDNLLVNVSGEYTITDGLKVKSTVGVRTFHMLQKVFRPEVLLYNPGDLSSLTQGVGGNPLSAWNRYDTQRDITFVTTLNYQKNFGEDHFIDLLGGFNQETNKFQRLQASKDNLPSNALDEISAGSTDPTAEGFTTDFGLQSFFGRVNYSFRNKYLFEANVRYDGSSNFGEGNKWGLFPSFSAGWNISHEDFMSNVDIIDLLKFRVSWGQLGNQEIDPNQYSAIYDLGQDYSFGGTLVGGAAQTNLPNPDVTWETSTQTNFGIDLEMFQGKLGLVADYYIKLTEDILRPINISSTIGGLSPPTLNLASVENRGWEFLLSHNNKIGDFSYNVNFNLTTIKNEVVELPAPVIEGFSRIEEGRSINEFYTIKMLGIFQNEAEIDAHEAQPDARPGDIKFEDFDGDGDIDDDDRQPAGSSIPDLVYGLNISIGYKGFDFSMLWQGVEGMNAITEEEQKPFFNSAGLPEFWLENAWTEENLSNDYPRLVRGSNYINNIWRNSSFLVEDASFLRLKNIQLGYTVPAEILEKIKVENLRIYLNATNPLTFTDYRGLDPEKEPFRPRGSYSNVQIYTVGLNISL